MKKITFLIALMAMSFGYSQTFTDNGGPYDMQNGNMGTGATCGTADEITLSIPVTGVGVLNTTNIIQSVTLNVTHTWNADIVISLRDPSGTVTRLLTDDIGGNGDGFVDLILQDGATALPTGNTNPVTGTFAPLETLSEFNTMGVNANGTWELLVCDDAGGDTGMIDNWSITFVPTPSCPAPIDLAAGSITTTSAQLSWTETGSASQYDIEWGPAGFTQGTGTLVTGQGNPYDLMSLTAFTSYDFYVRADCMGAGTSSYTGPFNFTTLANPPGNDECADAEGLTVNGDLNCAVVTSGTTLGATASSQADDVTGTPDNDVWYSFTATSTALQITLTNVVAQFGTSTDMGMGVYDGTGGCAGLAFFDDSDPNTLDLTGLNIGTLYYVRVYGWLAGPGAQASFDICVGTPPPPPANDECSTATNVGALPYTNSIDATSATNNAGFINVGGSCGGMNDGVWYTFTPSISGNVDIVVTNVVGWDPELQLYSGSCGAFTCEAQADAGFTGDGEEILGQAVAAGTTYYINLGNFSGFTDGAEGPFQIDISGTATLSTDSVENASAFSYYPNPVKNTLNIDAQNNIENVVMYNILGQEVLRTSPNSINSEVDMSALGTGAYFVKVTIAGATQTVKILKQ